MNTSLVTPPHLNQGIPDDPELHPIPTVNGLHIINRFLSKEAEQSIIRRIYADTEAWRSDLRRRVQHHGWRYDYKARVITPDMYLGQIPDYLQHLAQRLFDQTNLFPETPTQVIANEYLPGQGIGTHIDHPGFGHAIATISLLENWEIDFSLNWRDKTPALLPAGSCLLMTGPARSKWQHAIQARRHKPGPDGNRQRQRRVSLTFRTVLNPAGVNE